MTKSSTINKTSSREQSASVACEVVELGVATVCVDGRLMLDRTSSGEPVEWSPTVRSAIGEVFVDELVA